MRHLFPGAILQNGKYTIEKTLDQGGFGIVYLAVQSGLRRKVAVKEFFLKDYCERLPGKTSVSMGTEGSKKVVSRFKEKFIKEARLIAGMDNRHIVSVYDIFEENDTAYYVMEYLSGGSLNDIIPSDGFEESVAVSYIRQVSDALSYTHEQKNLLHLDVKPSNILFRANGDAVLIDFGISKHYDEDNTETSSTPVGMSRGYAPLEQYKLGGLSSFTPATDVYSLGAVLYKLLTGHTPPEAQDIYENGLPPFVAPVSDKVRSAVVKSMSPKRADRFQTVKEFLRHLDSVNENDLSEPVTVAYYEDGMLILNNLEYPLSFVKTGWFKRKSERGDELEKVELGPFWIGCNLLTQDIWEAVMGDNPSKFKGLRRPVENVSWDDCQEFILKLNELTGGNFRLPTEAEWEYAARGGAWSLGYYRSGNNSAGYVSWNSENSCGMTRDVGEKTPNELGVYDMNGNVSEWCSDWYAPYDSNLKFNPTGPENGIQRVHRGGGWRTDPAYCNVYERFRCHPENKFADIGFRLCADITYPDSCNPIAHIEEDESEES